MATLAGFEPRVFALRMQRPEPLDEKVKRSHYSDKNKILDKVIMSLLGRNFIWVNFAKL